MTQKERWIVKYEEVMGFLMEKHRNPSKHRVEEHDMLNWLKANREVIHFLAFFRYIVVGRLR